MTGLDVDSMKMQAIAPVNVAVISGTGDGGSPLTTGTMGTTPDHQPNIVIQVVTPIVAILVRFANDFCVSLAGSLTAGSLGTKYLPHTTVADMVQVSAFLAICIAGVGLVKNAATVFSGLEKKFPLASGSV